MKSLKELIERAKEIYPLSRYQQKQWVRQSFYLYASGKHRFLSVNR